jgi:hypothetical protein
MAAIVSIAESPGGTRSRKKRAIMSPSTDWISSPTITVSPSGAVSRAARAASMRSWSVIARCVRPRDTAARTTASGLASESKLARV